MVFDRHGPLAARIPEYRERSQQVEMANRVAGAIRDNAVLVCEAGTGTGKTFAYLVPALLSAGKVILSTGTKTLQDQLYHRDLPTVRTALNVPVTTALLKGRANYVCHYHLERNVAERGLSSRELARDVRAEALSGAKDMPDPLRLTAALDKAARDLRLALPNESARFTSASVRQKREFSGALAALDSALRSVCAALDLLSERSEGLARCAERARAAQALLERWCDDSRADLVRWIEVFSHSLRLNATPLSIAEIFRRQLDGHPRAWIFTSATLAVAGDFSHYRSEMGLDKARPACWDSPFAYAAQALIYVPKKLPDPNSDQHTPQVVAASLPVIQASGGSAFLLFTTLRAMRLAHELLR